MKVAEWNDAFAAAVVAWRYEPPYDFYNLASSPGDVATTHDPALRHHYRALVGDDGEVEAFWWLDPKDEAFEVGLGLRPDLTGRGLGESVFRAELDFVREHWAPATFRLLVTDWNTRAIRLYERIGFREVGRETRSIPGLGDTVFIRMEMPA